MSIPIPPNGPKHAALYARVATNDPATEEALGAQIDACQALVTQDGGVVPSAYVCVEASVSGRTLGRPALQQVRELIRSHAIAALYVSDPTRLSHNLDHYRLLTDECARHQVTVHLVTGRHVTDA
jgi:DNA invertase Pin-like site-specific DNA recombinase